MINTHSDLQLRNISILQDLQKEDNQHGTIMD
jgi:DNA repair photolyase